MGSRIRNDRGKAAGSGSIGPALAPDAPIAVPADEVARQAAVVLEAYTYQLYQTVGVWLSLRSDERLHIEFAEDFAISDDGNLDLRQIKKTGAALTLRSPAVAALIRSVWGFQKANPGREVTAALITTGKIGREKSLHFPGKAPGLIYWRVAAREQGDVEPIRAVLRTLDLPGDLREFLDNGSSAEIRNRILRPIRWLCCGPSQAEVEADLHERLVYFGQTQGVGAQDSKKALNALVVKLLSCVRCPPERRYVTSADLLTTFQDSTYRVVPPSQFIFRGPAGDHDVVDSVLATSDAARIPLPPRAALRIELIEDLHRDLVRNGKLWLHGSSGLGKTTLALLLVRRQNAAWMFADLRNLEPHALRLVLARIAATFHGGGARGLILDDLPVDGDNATILAIRRVARAVADADGLLIVTSPKQPSPTLASGLDLGKKAARETLYLTHDDVGEIVGNAGGEPDVWEQIIFAFCGGGHPQLVDARVMGLRQRGWPLDERLSDLAPFKAGSGDLEAERNSVRTRLLHELDGESRELLLRLSLLINNFDRSMMFAVAGTQPPLSQPGMLFDALVGPWIEHVGPDRYRLSPLLRDSGAVGLASVQQDSIRNALIDHLIHRRPFPADQLTQFFIFAFTLKNVRALTWFSGAVVHSAINDRKQFKRLAEELSPIAVVDRGQDKLLLPEDAFVSTMLRQAQLRVAIAQGDGKRAAKLLDRILFEIEHLTGEEKSHSLSLALGIVLMERVVPLSPARWMAMLQTLSAIPQVRRAIRQKRASQNPYSDLLVQASAEEVMFVVRATALKGIDELAELVSVLDDCPTAVRDRYLTAASRLQGSVDHIVSSAWLSAVQQKDFDGKAAAEQLATLRRTAARWTSRDMAIVLACAQAVMLDEYANNSELALRVLEDAQIEDPRDYRINRQRQKVYYRNGDHARALAEFQRFETNFPSSNPVDRTFSFREAGRSAAEMGELDKTRLFFEQAWKASRQCGDHMLRLTAGLSADCAILDFQVGKIGNALRLMMRALVEAEPIDPGAGLKERYCALILNTAILWMRGGAADWPVERQAMVVGMCSNPEPPSEIGKRPTPPRLLAWYELAELETEVCDDQYVLAALRERTKKGGLLPMESMLAGGLLKAAVRTLDVDRFISVLPIYVRAATTAAKHAQKQPLEEFLNMPVGLLKPVSGVEWTDQAIKEAAISSILLFGIAAICSDRRDAYNELRSRLVQVDGLGSGLTPLFDVIDNPMDHPDDLIAAVASTLGRMARSEFVFNASEAFMATVYIVQLLRLHILGEVVAGPALVYFFAVWRDVLSARGFSVRSPGTNGPLIIAASSKGADNRAKLANLVLASHPAVREHLSDSLRTIILGMTEQRRTPLADLQDDQARAPAA